MKTVVEALEDAELYESALATLRQVDADLPLWQRDQFAAAAAEAASTTHRPEKNEPGEFFVVQPTDEDISAKLALIFSVAAAQRGLVECPHLKAHQIVPILINLSAHYASCNICSDAFSMLAVLNAVDDGQCDFCQGDLDEGSSQITTAAAHMRMIGYFCSVCTAGLRSIGQ